MKRQRFGYGLLFFGFLFGLNGLLLAQNIPVHQGQEVVVTGERFVMSYPFSPRKISVLPWPVLQEIPAISIPEMLNYVPGFDLRERGFAGIQADPSVRGSSFEQVLLILDGIRVVAPQTGHHLLNLPLDPEFVDRVEVLHGAGSAFEGPGAFGGAVRVVTRFPDTGMNLQLGSGYFGSYAGKFRWSGQSGAWRHALVLSRDISAGYRENTDFSRNLLCLRSATRMGAWQVEASAGYLDKKFGANSFYSARFPYQWEHTTTGLMTIRLQRRSSRGLMQVTYAYRQNRDTFVLDKNRPDWYWNKHRTNTQIAGVQWQGENRLGRFWLYGDVASSRIRSSNLGHHRRQEAVLAVGQQLTTERMRIHLSGSAFWMEGWPPHFSPGLSVLYRLNEKTYLFGSMQHGFRTPSFTELYYRSPANVGNSHLRPETNWNYEAGLRWGHREIMAEITLFQRRERNLIDWVRQNGVWYAQNYQRVHVTGSEFSFWVLFPSQYFFKRLMLAYTRLHFRKENREGVSKYAFQHLPHQALVRLLWRAGKVSGFVGWRLWLRYGKDWENVLDASIQFPLRFMTVRVVACNLADHRYEHFPGVSAPGRWIRLFFIWNGKKTQR